MSDPGYISSKYAQLQENTKWAVFYTYILQPLFTLIMLIQIIYFITNISYIAVFKYYLIFDLLMLILLLFTLILMMKFKRQGYYLNMLLLLCQCFAIADFSSEIASSFYEHYFMALSLWALPNIIYFYFRKDAFFNAQSSVSEVKINKNANRYVKRHFWGKSNAFAEKSRRFANRCGCVVRAISFDTCAYKIDTYKKPNKFLKFYLFYFIPIIIVLLSVKTYNTQTDKYICVFLNILYLISYFYMLKFSRRGLYLNIACVTFYIIYSLYCFVFITPLKHSMPDEICFTLSLLELVCFISLIRYLRKRKEMFERTGEYAKLEFAIKYIEWDAPDVIEG